MAEFTVRVVLHDATWEDYIMLHEQMAARNLHDYIRSDDGRWYRLPDAEYYGEGNVTIERCREIAAEAATATERQFAIFVTEGSVRAWQGLQEIAIPD